MGIVILNFLLQRFEPKTVQESAGSSARTPLMVEDDGVRPQWAGEHDQLARHTQTGIVHKAPPSVKQRRGARCA